MERDNEKDITILRDNVQVIFDQNYISCNEAIVLWSKNEVIAVGDVLLRSSTSDIQADKIIYNFKDEKGKIYNGTILSGQMLIQSEYIDKTGPDTFVADDAYFTTCTTCPASWSFTAQNVEATIESYAYIKSSWMHFLEFPSVYFPYLILPLKNRRQTGLLPPTFQFDQERGASLRLPFFWAINRSQDMTLGLQYYENSGLQYLANYRYVLSEKSSGELDYAILKDRHLEKGAASVHNKNRWHLAYSHYFELPNDYIQRTNIYLVSDLNYSSDFPRLFNFLGQPALDNRSSLTKYNPDFHLSLDASYYMSLLEPTRTGNTATATMDQSKKASVHRLPEVRFSITDKKITETVPLFFRFDSQYINFARQGLGYDTPVGTATDENGNFLYNIYEPVTSNGFFDPTTDKIRTGQRFDAKAHIYSPIRLLNNRIDFTPFLTYRYTQYLLGALNETQNYDFFPDRQYLQYGVNTSTEFSRISESGKYRHNIKPEISFQTTPYIRQKDHAFFGTQEQLPYFFETQPLQDQDLDPGGRGLQFDYEDRIIGRRIVNFALSNQFIRKNENSFGENSYDQVVLFRLSQAYDFIEANRVDGHPWQDVRGLLDVHFGSFQSITETFYFPYHEVVNVNTGLRTNLWHNSYIDVTYTNYLNVPRLPEDVRRETRQESILLSGSFNINYISVSGIIEYSLIEGEITRYQIDTMITPPGNCWTIGTSFTQNLNESKPNVGSVNLEFRFGN